MRLVHLLLALTLGAALAACSPEGGGATAEDSVPDLVVPDGWTSLEAAGVGIAAPPSWSIVETTAGVIDIAGPDAPDDALVQIRVGAPDGVTAAEALDVAVLALEFDLDEIEREGDTEPWTPPGSDDGALLQLSYDQRVDGDVLRIAELTGIAVGHGLQIKVRALDRADEFDGTGDTLRRIIDTIVIIGDPATSDA